MMTLTSTVAIAGFALPHASANSKLHRLLGAALPKEVMQPNQSQPHQPACIGLDTAWQPDFFKLNHVTLFQESTLAEQAEILAIANRNLLEESYRIEQAGVGYMAKMVLLAETQEERSLYALFTGDEAQHLAQIQQFLPQELALPADPFLQLLTQVVEQAEKPLMQFVLQVVLEGWGLTHYRRLATSCQQPQLQACFSGFIEAEARHHGLGLVAFDQTGLSSAQETAVLDIMSQFLHMIQVGPQTLLQAIATVKGSLSRSQRIQVLTELDTVTHSGQRLQTLYRLMRTAHTQRLLDTLGDRGCFQPLSAEQAA